MNRQITPLPNDLFGQIPVTKSDLYEYIERFAPRLVCNGWRVENYIKSYNVADKVRRLKTTGEWWL